MEVGLQNTAMAGFIAVNLMGSTEASRFPELYFIVMLLTGCALVWHRSREERAQKKQALREA